jgi:hypothetical protein
MFLQILKEVHGGFRFIGATEILSGHFPLNVHAAGSVLALRQIAESLIEGRSVPGSLSHLTICTGVAEGLGQVAVKVAAPPVHETPDLPELLHDAADSA